MAEGFNKPGKEIDVERLHAEALGEPGSRRFRLLASIQGETYIVWMEKQQLQALGLAIEQMLDQLPERGPELESADVPLEFNTETRQQFRVGRMELGYEEIGDRIVLSAHDVQEDDEEPQTSLDLRITRNQARQLSADAAVIVAAGRPRCPMCGAPMDPGIHVCPQQNGHLPLREEGPAG
ncbi:MAG: DUF3090 family protein [Chloroflexia bacterium]|nr:DUF3090 family protein [Chloroflexia bacterium]